MAYLFLVAALYAGQLYAGQVASAMRDGYNIIEHHPAHSDESKTDGPAPLAPFEVPSVPDLGEARVETVEPASALEGAHGSADDAEEHGARSKRWSACLANFLDGVQGWSNFKLKAQSDIDKVVRLGAKCTEDYRKALETKQARWVYAQSKALKDELQELQAFLIDKKQEALGKVNSACIPCLPWNKKHQEDAAKANEDVKKIAPLLMEASNLWCDAPSLYEEEVEKEIEEKYPGKLKLVKKLGSGSFGETYRLNVSCAEEGEAKSVVVKVAAEVDDKKRKGFDTEVAGLHAVDSPYVLKLVGETPHWETFGPDGRDAALWLLMEDFNGGELPEGREDDGPDDLRKKAMYYFQLVEGLEEIHKKGWLHLDVKPENALVNCGEGDAGCYAAHIDMGLAARKDDPEKCAGGLRGTPVYAAPEMMKTASTKTKPVCSTAMDVWSMGMLLALTWSDTKPAFVANFLDDPFRKIGPLYQKLAKWKVEEEKAFMSLDQEVKDILYATLQVVPNKRIGIQKLKELAKTLAEHYATPEGKETLDKTPTERGARKPAPTCLF